MRDEATFRVKSGLATMLQGGVIMDVVDAEQAKIAEDAGAAAVMALERVPADIRRDGGGNPLRDAFTPEAESDESDALYGEPDDIPSTEVTSNPSDPDDPAAGPGLDADEGPRDRDRG